jgi:hypothetical protein
VVSCTRIMISTGRSSAPRIGQIVYDRLAEFGRHWQSSARRLYSVMKHNVSELDQIILEVVSDDFEPFESVVSKLSHRCIGIQQQFHIDQIKSSLLCITVNRLVGAYLIHADPPYVTAVNVSADTIDRYWFHLTESGRSIFAQWSGSNGASPMRVLKVSNQKVLSLTPNPRNAAAPDGYCRTSAIFSRPAISIIPKSVDLVCSATWFRAVRVQSGNCPRSIAVSGPPLELQTILRNMA